ncbi:MAG: acyltransferase [Lentisphaerae bacterium]|nr:acyltransferase [Lentisphaerota bacterium]
MAQAVDPTDIKQVAAGAESALRRYARLTVGTPSLPRLIAHEALTCPLSGIPGAAGILLRRLFYRLLFARMGRGTAIGRDVTVRGGARIRLGSRVFVDDLCVLDARGPDAEIHVADNVVLSRNTVVRARNGAIRIGAGADIGCNCLLATDSRLDVGPAVLVGAYAYLCAGGLHRIDGPGCSILGRGLDASRGIAVGEGAWIGAHTVVLDGVTVGAGAVVGANSLVNASLPAMAVAYGSPARVQRTRGA